MNYLILLLYLYRCSIFCHNISKIVCDRFVLYVENGKVERRPVVTKVSISNPTMNGFSIWRKCRLCLQEADIERELYLQVKISLNLTRPKQAFTNHYGCTQLFFLGFLGRSELVSVVPEVLDDSLDLFVLNSLRCLTTSA